MGNYEPQLYTKPLEEFSPEEREFVDVDINIKDRSRKGHEWNSLEYRDDDVVYRKSWITDDEERPIIYRLDSYAAPM